MFARWLFLWLTLIPALAWADLSTSVSVEGQLYSTPSMPMRPPEVYCTDIGTASAECDFPWGSVGATASYGDLGLWADWFYQGNIGGDDDAAFSDSIRVNSAVPGTLEFVWLYQEESAPINRAPAATINGAFAPMSCYYLLSPCITFMPFVPGVPVSISAELDGWVNLDQSMYTAPTSQLILEDIIVTDSGGNPIGASLQSASGTAYPLDPSNVPEPGSLLLFGTVLIGILGTRRRKSNR